MHTHTHTYTHIRVHTHKRVHTHNIRPTIVRGGEDHLVSLFMGKEVRLHWGGPVHRNTRFVPDVKSRMDGGDEMSPDSHGVGLHDRLDRRRRGSVRWKRGLCHTLT